MHSIHSPAGLLTATPRPRELRSAVPAPAAPQRSRFFRKHPVVSFYALTFAISWSGVLLVIGGPGAIPGTPEQVEARMLYAVLALFAGPSITGLVMTGLVHGRAGYRDLLWRLVKWRVGIGWYAAALLIAPVVFIGVGLLSPSYYPSLFVASDKGVLLLLGVVAAVMSLLEEIGWTGFATPELRQRSGVLTTGLVVGGLWGVWHSLLNSWSNGAAFGALPLGTFLILYVVVIGIPHLTAYRMLIVRVYDRTGSLLLAWLMHASFAASTFVLGPVPLTGVGFLTWFLTVTVAFWVVVGAVTLADRQRRGIVRIGLAAVLALVAITLAPAPVWVGTSSTSSTAEFSVNSGSPAAGSSPTTTGLAAVALRVEGDDPLVRAIAHSMTVEIGDVREQNAGPPTAVVEVTERDVQWTPLWARSRMVVRIAYASDTSVIAWQDENVIVADGNPFVRVRGRVVLNDETAGLTSWLGYQEHLGDAAGREVVSRMREALNTASPQVSTPTGARVDEGVC